jgi:hypothetical protein
MRGLRTFVAVLLVAGTIDTLVAAAEPAACTPWRRLKAVAAALPLGPNCGCPDDYACKPLPPVTNECRGCEYDYCVKPLPAVCPAPGGCCDDYCPKPWRPTTWCPPCVYRCFTTGCAPR